MSTIHAFQETRCAVSALPPDGSERALQRILRILCSAVRHYTQLEEPGPAENAPASFHCVDGRRDTYLDFYRGAAAVSIVFIHTVFWSGEWYVPEVFRSLALLLDVPFFVFLSGWGVYYSTDIKKIFDSTVRTWLRYLLFISLADIAMIGILHRGEFSPLIWINQCFFSIRKTTFPDLPVVRGSLWFMPMWIPVVLAGGALTSCLRRCDGGQRITRRVLLFFLIGVICFSTETVSAWFLCSRDFCFYMVFFLLGYCSVEIRISWRGYWRTCAALGCLWLLIAYIFQISPWNLQSAKFPPHVMYLEASLLSVVTAVFLRGKLDKAVRKCRLLGFIGRNALCFYFAQGIGASLLYQVYPVFLPQGWPLTLTVCFAVNLGITGGLGTALVYFYRFVETLFQKTGR